MKHLKYILLIVALFSFQAMQAQIRLGVKGGLVFNNNTDFDMDYFKSDNIMTYQIGPSLETMLGSNFGIDASILFSQKGFKSDDKTMKSTYLEVPANLKYKFTAGIFVPYIAAGPYVSFRIAGDKVWDIKDSDIGGQVKSKSFCAGLNFAVGVELIQSLQVGLNYNLALTDNYETFEIKKIESYKGKTHTLALVAAYYF